MPWVATLAGVVGLLSGLPLVFLTAVAWAYVGDPDLGPWPAVGVTVLTVGQFSGAVRLLAGRSWRLLTGASLAVVVAVPVAGILTSAGTSEPAAETIAGVSLLQAGPLLTVLLASSPRARRWASPPSSLPADCQPVLGLRP